MSKAQFFAPITKVDYEKREVWGTLAEEVLDKSKEILDYDGSKPYFQKWNENFTKLTSHVDEPSVGNLREMHNPKKGAAGKFIQMSYDDDAKKIHVGAKVVDKDAWEKVVEGVYTGFSIGGDYIKRYDDPTLHGAKRYIADPSEGSLVDNPCMYGATFSMFKADGTQELKKFVGSDETRSHTSYTIEKFDNGSFTFTPVGSTDVITGVTMMTVAKSGQTKRVDGSDLGPSAFLIVGKSDDPSTWHLPVDFPTEEQTVNHIHAAMGRVDQVEGVSAAVKAEAARKLASLASKHGIHVKDFNQKFVESLPDPIQKALSELQKVFEVLSGVEPDVPAKEAVTADLNTMKGGGPEMLATSVDKLKKGIEGAKTPEDFAKYASIITKAVNHMAKVAEHVDAVRDAHTKMGDHVDAMCDHMGKAAGPMHEHVKAVSDNHTAMAGHLDKAEGSIEDFESEAESEVDKDSSQKSAGVRLVKRMERGFEARLAKQQREHEKVLGKFVDALEKIGGNGAQAVAAPVIPARTFVAPEKNADATGAGGVVLAKGVTASGVPTTNIAPVDAYGMPNPEYVAKAEASNGEDFVKAAKLTKLQQGNPFPKEFGSASIF